jgi:hypothetical protein
VTRGSSTTRLRTLPQQGHAQCLRETSSSALVLAEWQRPTGYWKKGAFDRHPCTQRLVPEVLAEWKVWAAEHARAFQRASSAVEGRNGYLSQMQHNHRGLPKRCYQVWTVLHNFDCRTSDGTTPASRFFKRGFPDLLESVLSQIDDLPWPRQRHQALVTLWLESAGHACSNG